METAATTRQKTDKLHEVERTMLSPDALPQVLFSRYEDGTRPVTVLPTGDWELQGAPGTPPQRFSTAKGLLVALTGHPEGRHWSLERYFRLGPKFSAHSPRLVTDIYDLWPVADDRLPTPLLQTTPGISIPADRENPHLDAENVEKTFRETKTILLDAENVEKTFRETKTILLDAENVEKTFSRSGRRTPAVRPMQTVGIDLERRSHEVRKLLFAGFGRRMYACGYDPEDVLQEVYRGLLVRNSGKCPWDPAKSSFGHYVHMVCSCILSNYHRKQHRTREMEQVGLLNPLGSEGEGTRYTDVASSATVASRAMLVQEDCLMMEEAQDLLAQMQQGSQDAESRLAAKVLPLLLAGTPREDIASSLGVSPASLSRALSHLRKQAAAWATP